MSTRYSVAEARDQLPRLIRRAEAGQAVELTRRGKPVAVIVPVSLYQRLSGSSLFWNALEEYRDRTRLETKRVGDEVFADLRDRSPGREVEL